MNKKSHHFIQHITFIQLFAMVIISKGEKAPLFTFVDRNSIFISYMINNKNNFNHYELRKI